jgi:glycosyltransferase involved in cell wall biosynthesis
MTFIFWQPILCKLQSAYIRNIAEKHRVILVAEKKLNSLRIEQGFKVPDYGKVEVIVAPDELQINQLFQLSDVVHIISGVWAYNLPNKALRLAIKHHQPIGLFSESFNWTGLKGKFRFVKYWWFRFKYARYIRFILTTGKRGRWCFETVGFDKSIIYDWAYISETPQLPKIAQPNEKRKPQMLFIGQINTRKNILFLVDVCKRLGIINQLRIIGGGKCLVELKKNIENTDCQYLGEVIQDKSHQNQIIADSDVLILPSLYDGWGAVVNEALMCGTPAIVSNHCGASVLLQSERGRVFSIENDDLEEVLSNFIKELPYNIDKRKKIRDWALQNISGEVAAKYFNEIMQYVFNRAGQRPVAPWLKKS